MSRDFRDDVHDERLDREIERTADVRVDHQRVESDLFDRHLDLARGATRERFEGRDRDHLLNEDETRALATIGAFRVVSADDLIGTGTIDEAGLRHLCDDGLVARETLTDTAGSQRILSLTQEGKDLLEAHRQDDAKGPEQVFYADVVKPRELGHDVQIYRAFTQEQERIEADGGHVTRVVLDYELKHEYQSFLNREDRPEDAILESDRRVFAEANELHVVRGHLELPDLRIEYETADGRLHHRDVE